MSNVIQLFKNRRFDDVKAEALNIANRRVTKIADQIEMLRLLTDAYCICMEECSNDNVDKATVMYNHASQSKDQDFIESIIAQLKAMSTPMIPATIPKCAY